MEILKRPLIFGASLSANRNSVSPGRKLALRFTSPDAIVTEAMGGRAGRDTLKKMDFQMLAGRTIAIGLDLLFWDSTLRDVTESLKALDQLICVAEKNQIPIVVGNVPALLPHYQPSLKKINEALETKAAASSCVQIFDFSKMHRELQQQGYLEIKGQRMTLSEIVPDGLHLSDRASNFLADRLLDLIQARVVDGKDCRATPSTSPLDA